tara:strand:+ start:43 stop:291 length:249 start_codon:yes stop_codon:yes gene_type:complete
MGQMKRIYEMVQDGSADLFKDAYKLARLNNEIAFTFNYKTYDMATARAMLSLIAKAEDDYDDWVDSQAEMHVGWRAEIARGK